MSESRQTIANNNDSRSKRTAELTTPNYDSPLSLGAIARRHGNLNEMRSLSPVPSLLSLRIVENPPEIRMRYKDASKYLIWPTHHYASTLLKADRRLLGLQRSTTLLINHHATEKRKADDEHRMLTTADADQMGLGVVDRSASIRPETPKAADFANADYLSQSAPIKTNISKSKMLLRVRHSSVSTEVTRF